MLPGGTSDDASNSSKSIILAVQVRFKRCGCEKSDRACAMGQDWCTGFVSNKRKLDSVSGAQMPCCPSSIQACKTRTVLTLQQALQIFEIKLEQSNSSAQGTLRQRRTAAAVARSFGVSEKTVRDIWIGRTWVREMMHLDPARAAKAHILKLPGRPRRAKSEGNECYLVQHNPPCFLGNCFIRPTAETVKCNAIPVCEGNSYPSIEPPDSIMANPSNMEDPFHNDWPDWAAADLWEQYAHASGYIIAVSRQELEVYES